MAAFWARTRPLAAALGVAASSGLATRRPVLSDDAPKKEFVTLKCLQSEAHTHDTRKITLGGLVAGPAPVFNVAVRAPLGPNKGSGPEKISRNYNPIAVRGDGTLTLLVKKYADAKMGTHLHGLQPGDTVEVKGPNRQWAFQPGTHDEYAMIAGGTGITPLIQAADYILKNDVAKVTVVCANKTAADMLLTKELDALQSAFPDRLKVERLAEDEVGNVSNKDLLKKLLPPASSNVLIMVCGPPPMTKAVAGAKTKDFKQGEVDGVLKELGYASAQVWRM